MLNILVGLYSFIKKIALLFFCLTMPGCKNTNVKTNNKLELRFLDEFILPEERNDVCQTATLALNGHKPMLA